jgi:alkylation response protein AidB-like acyl-CoA dehydrogenase
MDFNFRDEQQMLADTLGRWLTTDYDFDIRRKLAASPQGFSEDNWRRLADLGVLGINVPEQYGGLGGTPVETLIAMHAFGRALLVEPFMTTAVIAAALIARAASEDQRAAWLPGIVDGSRRFALATLEPGARFELDAINTIAAARDGGYVLDGRKAVVLDGAAASQLIVSARANPNTVDASGIGLFVIDRDAAGVSIESFPTLDGMRAAEVTLRSVRIGRAALLAEPGVGFEHLEWAVDRGIAALCAEAVGTMERLTEMTAEHLKNRRQFGQPLASFQALQHRLADMLIAVEQARSMALMAAARVDDPERSVRRAAISAAKVIIGRSGRYVGQQAVQLHGGMGMTDELAIGYYFKRLTCIDFTWGNWEHHMELYGDAA